MKNLESPAYGDCAEQWITPREPGEPLFRLDAEGERYTASFALSLNAVKNMGVQTPDAERQSMPLWPLLQSAGQRLEIVQRCRHGHLRYLLRGYSQSKAQETALLAAQECWRGVAAFLSDSRSPYHFVASDNPDDLMAFKGSWQAVLQPLGLILRPNQGIHYRTEDLPAEIHVAYPTLADPASYLIGLAAHNEIPMALRVALRPVHLSPALQADLQSRLDSLEWGTRLCYPSGEEVRNLELVEAVRKTLEHWRTSNLGYAVYASVIAPEPIPDTLLAMLGQEIMHDRPIQWRTAESGQSSNGDSQTRLDLSHIMPTKECLPPLFPNPSTLAAHGMPTHYTLRPGQLANQGTVLGQIGVDSTAKAIRLTADDRARHCYVLGATGTGKSSLLFNLIRQDIERGEGVCLIDPHGDLYQQILAAVPEERFEDVVLIEPGDSERAVGINFLECGGSRPQVQMQFVTNEMLKIFDQLYDLDKTGGPLFEQYMRNALLLIMDSDMPGGTLMDVPHLFEDAAFRHFLLSQCRNPYVKSFWEDQAEQAGGEISFKNMAPYITSKLNQFTSNAILRPIIGQARSTIDFLECMDRRRIVLVNLPKGLLGDLDTRLLGMLIVGKLFGAALQRALQPAQQRRPFYLYVDEAHNLTTDTVASLMAEARKFGLNMILANQNLGQMGNTGDAILGNVGNLLLFRLGVMDAERLQTYVRPELSVRDLEDLPNHHVAARLLMEGRPTRPFVFTTLPLTEPVHAMPYQERLEAINNSQTRYTQSIAKVEKAIRQRRREIIDLERRR